MKRSGSGAQPIGGPLPRDDGFRCAPAPLYPSYELLGFGLRTDGSVHVHQIKSLDWTARKASFVEKVPDVIVRQVLDCLAAVLEDD